MRSMAILALIFGNLTLAHGLVVGASTAVVGSLVQEVAGEHGQVITVVPPGTDPHTFEPRPSVVRQLHEAEVFFVVGLGYEYWLDDLARNLADQTRVVELGEDLPDLICLPGSMLEHHDHEHGACNPHVWLDPNLAGAMIEQIAAALSELEPDHAQVYQQNSRALQARIKAIDAETRACLDQIPSEHKKIVVQHDAFAYLARSYGLEQVGSLATVSAQEMGTQSFAKLVDRARQEGVKAVFVEPQLPRGTANALAQEIGAEIYLLYSDSFDAEVDSYLELLQANSATLCKLLSTPQISAFSLRC